MPINWEFLKSDYGKKYIGKTGMSETKEYIKDYNKWVYETKKKNDPNYVRKITEYQKTEKYKEAKKKYNAKRRAKSRAERPADWVDKRTSRTKRVVNKKYFMVKLKHDENAYKDKTCECGGEYNSRNRWTCHSKTRKHLKWIDEEFGHLPPPPAEWI